MGNAAMLQGTSIETGPVVIEAVSDDLAAAHNDRAMAVVERRLVGLLNAQVEVVVGLHFDG